ncbi:MAG: diaminopimelate epimerase [Candidatus Wallbacteria bacterium]|nr:diaminopimelate epimerase [Candidatus Wallbacteria bacterium]
MISFTKMQALGNDFVIVSGSGGRLPGDLASFSRRVADRHFGVGCDQVIIIEQRDAGPAVRFFNSDGSEAEMCGNGLRCVSRFLAGREVGSGSCEIITPAGPVMTEIRGRQVMVDLGVPLFQTGDWAFDRRVIGKEVEIGGESRKISLVSVGNPHCVIFMPDLDNVDVETVGHTIESATCFPHGINVEFVKIDSRESVSVRVWERGAGETMACGSGAAATVVAACENGLTGRKVLVRFRRGELIVEYGTDGHVRILGDADFVFEGTLEGISL